MYMTVLYTYIHDTHTGTHCTVPLDISRLLSGEEVEPVLFVGRTEEGGVRRVLTETRVFRHLHFL